MMKQFSFVLSILILLNACNKPSKQNETTSNAHLQNTTVYETETLIVKRLTDHVYQHITFLNTQSFGRVPCNGMIVISGNEAIVFDTPADDSGSSELLDFISNKLNAKVTALVATHFHTRNISSYANNLTIRFLNEKGNSVIPQNGFDGELELNVGDKKVVAGFLGAGHTRDNIVGYFPDEQVLFGGCLVKEMGAGKGNLEDADTLAWSGTMVNLKTKYPDLKLVIPGHGKSGGAELLDYTEQLFRVGNQP
jgi:metallo-beta-lactamase class B